MSRDNSQDRPHGKAHNPLRDVIQLAEVRRRREAEKEDVVAPIRQEFMEELGDLLYEYLDTIAEATDGDEDKIVEELMAACSTVLAIAAEEHFEAVEDQIEFIDTVAEIASDLLNEDDSQGELFDDER